MASSASVRTLTPDQAHRIVRWTSRSGVARAHGKGVAWFRSRLLPALNVFERSARTTKDRRLLSGAYYVVGDIHDFNHAPRAAISAYRRSLRFDPSEAAAWREIGGMLEWMGHHTRARTALRRALVLAPDDEYAQSDLRYLEAVSKLGPASDGWIGG